VRAAINHPYRLSGFLGGGLYRFEFKSKKHVPTSVRKFQSIAVNHIFGRTKDIDHSAGLILAGTNTRPDSTYHVAYIKAWFMGKVSATHGQFSVRYRTLPPLAMMHF
jgi:hypothetical protein